MAGRRRLPARGRAGRRRPLLRHPGRPSLPACRPVVARAREGARPSSRRLDREDAGAGADRATCPLFPRRPSGRSYAEPPESGRTRCAKRSTRSRRRADPARGARGAVPAEAGSEGRVAAQVDARSDLPGSITTARVPGAASSNTSSAPICRASISASRERLRRLASTARPRLSPMPLSATTIRPSSAPTAIATWPRRSSGKAWRRHGHARRHSGVRRHRGAAGRRPGADRPGTSSS